MKKLFILLAISALTLSAQAQAQSFESYSNNLSVEVGNKFEALPLSYIYWGLKTPANLQDNEFAAHTNFGRSQEFGFNLIEFQFHPYRTGTISLGIDLDWDYYKLWQDYMWTPMENKSKVTVIPAPFSRVKQSQLSVMSFNFPLNFTQHFGSVALNVGATAEINLAGIHRFRGIDLLGNEINNRNSGTYFSKDVKTNLFTFDIHATVAYGGVGIYFRYNPMPVLAEGNPQFNIITVGLILGLDM